MVSATPLATSFSTMSANVTVPSVALPSTAPVAVMVIAGMVMLVAVSPASASALSTRLPEKMSRSTVSSTLESIASMLGIDTFTSEGARNVASATGAGLVLVFWAQAGAAGRAMLSRQAVARAPRRRLVGVRIGMVSSPVGKTNLGHRAHCYNTPGLKLRGAAGTGPRLVNGGQDFDFAG